MSTQKNLITLCFATVFALGLAACGGGGDAPVASMMDGDDTDDTMTSSLVGKVIPDGTVVMLPAGLVDGLTATYDAMVGNTVDVPGVGSFKCVAGPCAVDIANNEVTTTGDIEVVSLADLPDDVLMALADAIPSEPAGPTPEQQTAAAATKAEAIATEAAQTTEAGLGGSVAADQTSTYSRTVERDRDGTTVEIADTDMAGEDDPKFVPGEDLDGGRTMLVRTMEPNDDGEVVEEVVIVKTDIAAPKATKFATVYPPDLSTNTMNDNPDVTFEALMVVAGTGDVNLPLVKSDAFAAGTGAVLTFARFQEDSDNAMDGNQRVEAFETAGTYDGAMGTYKCNATGTDDCTVTVDAEGKITAVSDGWIFTPAEGATSDVADADYLHYGFWLKRTTDADGATTYNEVETFAAATGFPATGTTGLDDVEGSATYEGGSVGVYVKNVLDDQGDIASATSGHFSADVELTADFGGGDLPVNNQFTIGGKITDFVLSGGEENDWAVGLGLADFSGRTDGNEPGKSESGNIYTDMFSGVATGDSTAAAGSWNGAFYGSSEAVDHDDDATTDEINPAPVAVVGEFNANFTDGTAAGGFGANKK